MHIRRGHMFVWVLVPVVSVALSVGAFAQTALSPAPPIPQLLASELSDTVQIEATVARGSCAGTGVIVAANEVLTADHVPTCDFGQYGATQSVLVVAPSGQTYSAQVEQATQSPDLALLEVPGVTPNMGVAFAGASAGEAVSAIGNPYNLGVIASSGVIGAATLTLPSGVVPMGAATGPYTETNATLAPGNSGGPVFSPDGNIVGLADMGMASGINFLVPASQITAFLDGTVSSGSLPAPQTVWSTDGQVFNRFSAVLQVEWSSVPGATTYQVTDNFTGETGTTSATQIAVPITPGVPGTISVAACANGVCGAPSSLPIDIPASFVPVASANTQTSSVAFSAPANLTNVTIELTYNDLVTGAALGSQSLSASAYNATTGEVTASVAPTPALPTGVYRVNAVIVSAGVANVVEGSFVAVIASGAESATSTAQLHTLLYTR